MEQEGWGVHKRLTVFLGADDIKRVQTVCDAKNLTPTQAISKLVCAGFRELTKKEVSA